MDNRDKYEEGDYMRLMPGNYDAVNGSSFYEDGTGVYKLITGSLHNRLDATNIQTGVVIKFMTYRGGPVLDEFPKLSAIEILIVETEVIR